MSKIYEALKKAEQERERSRSRPSPRASGPTTDHGNVAQEDYQRLRASVVSMAVPSGLHTVLISASNHGEGATTVAVGLATALAKERETRVLLVEANVRTPCLGAVLPLATTAGLSDFAAGRAAPEALVTRLEDVNLSVIAAGNAPSPAMNLEVVDALLTRLQSQFDFVILDGPPVNNYADASVIATKVDGVILVVEADRTPVAEAEAAKRQLDKVGARILGVVLNRRRSYIPAFLESIL
ncbi:MAG TPA: CpsD/CapB family tyrosine-protein kinase [Candidatus Acidoferrales bacterium]|nr:CpsD/CapB family tyrosine-protein kinase [Candidatus Acidoferrales bacterium]